MSMVPDELGLPTDMFVKLAYLHSIGRDRLILLRQSLTDVLACLNDDSSGVKGHLLLEFVMERINFIDGQLKIAIEHDTEFTNCLNVTVELATRAYELGIRPTRS